VTPEIGVCHGCGYRGEVWPGRYRGQSCWTCSAIEHGNPPAPSQPGVGEAELPPARVDPLALLKYNGVARRRW